MKRLNLFAEKLIPILLLMTMLAFPWSVSAQSWDELSPQQQRILKPFSSRWSELDQDKRARLVRGAERWKNMTPAQRKQMKQRFNRWQQLSQQQRDAIKERFKKFQNLTPAQKAKVRKAFHRFRSLPADQRKQYRERWKRMSPAQRKRWLQHYRDKRNHDS